MPLLRILVLLAIALTVGFAPAPFPKRERASSKDDLQAMQGIWRLVGKGIGGKDSTVQGKARVKGNRWTFINATGSDGPAYDLTLDQTVSPRALEWRSGSSSWVASYRIQGKTLTIIYASGSIKELNKRPTDFTNPSASRFVYEFERRE